MKTTIILMDEETEVARREVIITDIMTASVIRFEDNSYTFGYKVHGENMYVFQKSETYTIES